MKEPVTQKGTLGITSRTFAIAHYTLLEAWRNRIAWLFVGMVVVCALVSLFVRELALTESDRVQLAALASIMRMGSVFIIVTFVLQGMAREFQDKTLELLLSLELPRTSYLAGKLVGFMLLSAAAALLISLPLLPLAPPQSIFLWSYTHMLELWIVSAFALFCVSTFVQFLPSATFVLAFYVLARSITAIQLISRSSLAEQGAMSDLGRHLADAIALVLPRLDAFGQTAWLMNTTATQISWSSATLQAAIYVSLLFAAAAFDMHRRAI